MLDEVTGLECEPAKLEPLWIVTDGQGRAFSVHPSAAKARAWIKWLATGDTKHLIVEQI
jgi:hypothetical protein